MSNSSNSDFFDAYRLGNAIKPFEIDGVPSIVLCDDQRVCSLEHLKQNPSRRFGEIQCGDIETFVALCREHKQDSSRIFYWPKSGLSMIVDFHGLTPGWCRFRITFKNAKAADAIWNTEASRKSLESSTGRPLFYAQFLDEISGESETNI